MDELIVALKFVSLFVGIAWGTAVVARAIHAQDVSQAQMFMMSIGVASFVTLQWLL